VTGSEIVRFFVGYIRGMTFLCYVQNEVFGKTFLIFRRIFKRPVKFVTVGSYGFQETYKQNTKYSSESNITTRRHSNLRFLDSAHMVTLFVVAQSYTNMLLILIRRVITFIRTTYFMSRLILLC
jgi:hypothetical protein